MSDSSNNSGCLWALMIAGAIIALIAGTGAEQDLAESSLRRLLNEPTTTAAPQFAVGQLPTVNGTGGAATATTAAPTVTAAPETTPPTTVAPQQQQPAQTNPPPPPAQCGFPGSISVSGANTGSVGGSGGTVTATGSSVSASTGGLVNCGPHYALTARVQPPGGGFTSRTECGTSSVSITVATNPNDTVIITLELPPNACG